MNGRSATDRFQESIDYWRPETPDHRREAKMLAVEALLAYGSVYDGHKHANGSYRIEFEERLYVKSDFGLP